MTRWPNGKGAGRWRVPLWSIVALTSLVVAGCGTRVSGQVQAPTTPDVATSAGEALAGSSTAPAAEVPGSSSDPGPATAGSESTAAVGNPAGGSGLPVTTRSQSPIAAPSARSGGPASPSSPQAAGQKATTPNPPAAEKSPTEKTNPTLPPQVRSRVTVGSVGTFSGPPGAIFGPLLDGVKLWVRYINDRGGMNGHPVDLIVGDDGGDPGRHQSIVREFVERRKVISFLGNPEAIAGASSAQYRTEHRIPTVGSEGTGQYFHTSPVFFPNFSHGFAINQAVGASVASAASAAGKKKMAFITCVEAQICRDGSRIVPKQLAKHGGNVVYETRGSFTQPDFTAECLNAKSAGAEVFLIYLDVNSVSRLASSCARQGYHPVYSTFTGLASPKLKDDPNMEGAILVDFFAPFFLENTPGRKEFHEALARYAPGVVASPYVMGGWLAGKVLQAGGAELPEPPSNEALLAGLWKLNGDVLPDLTGPLLYRANQPALPTVCWYYFTPKDGKFVSPDGGNRHCTDYDPSGV